MGKIKLNLVSGAVVEKPLINAFKANNNSYVVLDNEMNGSMGLPIILVCKLENGRLIKISDQGEWQVVKEFLKNIIAGNQIEFININNEIPADDIYYTQLTLPVPSFDALKNAYNVGEKIVAPSEEVESPSLEVAVPIVNAVSTAEPETQNIEVSNEPVVEPIAVENPVIDISIPEVNIGNPIENVPQENIDFNTPMPTFGDAIVNPTAEFEQVSQNVEEVVPNPTEEFVASDVFKEQKDAFMQACENMFDALVQKFQKELENRK